MKFFFLPITVFLAAFSLLSCQPSSAQQTESAAPEISAAASPYQNLNVADFQKMMTENPDVVILDVRTPQEVAQGAIEGYQHLDIKNPDFRNQVQALDKEKTYLVYCRSGVRSKSACNIMAEAGFPNLYNLEGGYLAWTRQQPQKRTILNDH